MKTTIRNIALASVLFASASGAAFAAESIDISIKGVIKPSACTPTLSGDAIVDFGTIAANALSKTAATVLPSKIVQLTLNCEAATKVSLVGNDNRKGTANAAAVTALSATDYSSNSYGVGSVDGKKIGAYSLTVGGSDVRPTADGNSVDAILSDDSGSNWMSSSRGAFGDATRVISWAYTGGITPRAFKTIVQPIRVTLAIGKVSELPVISGEVPIDGSATISVKYL